MQLIFLLVGVFHFSTKLRIVNEFRYLFVLHSIERHKQAICLDCMCCVKSVNMTLHHKSIYHIVSTYGWRSHLVAPRPQNSTRQCTGLTTASCPNEDTGITQRELRKKEAQHQLCVGA